MPMNKKNNNTRKYMNRKYVNFVVTVLMLSLLPLILLFIAAKITEARVEKPGVDIEIADTGHGVPMDSMNNLAKPFLILEKDSSGELKPSGIGLAIAYSIVTLHGGEIYYSGNGNGCVWNIRLPII